MYIVKYSDQVHIARMHELASASLPYERVLNILRYTFNNLFIIYPLNGYFTILVLLSTISKTIWPFILP